MPGIYGDSQPRGLRVGSDANNAAEFYSLNYASVGMRLRKDGVESLAAYAVPSGVYSMHDYEISVTTTSVCFKVDGAVAGTFTSNIPTGALKLYVSTFDGGFGNVPVSLDSLSLSLTNSEVQGPPAIISFAPASGPVGTSVTITGTNIIGVAAVQFGGVDAPFTNNSPSLITAVVPPNAISGLITVLSTNGTASSSDSFEVEALDFTYATNNGAITITGYTGAGGAVTIPDAITGLPVTSILGFAYGQQPQWVNVTNITIPESVTSLGDFAFYYSPSSLLK